LSYYGSRPIHELTPRDLTEYLETLSSLALTTQKRHRAIITTLFNYALKQGYILANPLILLPHQPLPEREVGYFSSEQLDYLYSLLREAQDSLTYRLYAVVSVLHSTGMKVSELLALNLGDREFPLEVGRVIERYVRYYRFTDSNCLALFTDKKRGKQEITRLSYPKLYTDWQRLVKGDALLSDRILNDFRHTFALERVDLLPLEELQVLLGHKNINMTLRYKHIL
jgi:integrase/recombinase XerD